MKYFFSNLTRIGLRSFIIGLISFVVVVPLFCCLIIVPLSLANETNFNPWYLVIPFGLFLVLLFGGGFLLFGFVLFQRTRSLDALFAPLGIKGNPHNLFYRSYQGSWQNRDVGIYFARGPMMRMEISTPLQTRLGISGEYADTQMFASLAGKTPLRLNDPDLAGLVIYPHDENWARELFSNPEVKAIAQRLILQKTWFNRQQIIINPGWITLLYSGTNQLLAFNFNISQQEAQAWLDDLYNLARLAENLPVQYPVVETGSERLAESLRKNNRSLSKIMIAMMVILVVGLPVLIIGGGVLLTLIILSLD